MLIRELQKDKMKWQVILGGSAFGVVTREGRQLECHVTRKTDFDEALQRRIGDGWKETESSLSRRVFLHGSEADGKFWIIQLDDDFYVIQHGKISPYGYGPESGQKKAKYFESADEARIDYHKEIEKILRQGYKEHEARRTEYSDLPAHLQGKQSKKRKSPTKSMSAVKKKLVPAESNRRAFFYDDGKSRKFWKIELDGAKHVVHFGRLGTDGQQRTKEFDSEAKARASLDKLVAEKLAKGYVESETKGEESKKSKGTSKIAAEPARPAVVAEATNRIELDPGDWFWAMWRDPDPLRRPEPRRFDLEACLESIRNSPSKRGRFSVQYPAHDTRLSPEEAEFWMEVAHLEHNARTPRSLCDTVGKMNFTGRLSVDALKQRHKKQKYLNFHYLTEILSAEDFVDLLLALQYAEGHEIFRNRVLPFLTRPQRATLAQIVSLKAKTAKVPKTYHDDYDVSYYVAAALGCSDVVEMILAQSPPSGHWYSKLNFVWGLGSAERVEAEVDRIRRDGYFYALSDQLRAWLAHTESRRLDLVRDVILQSTKGWGGTAETAGVLALVKAPEAAPFMLEIRQSGKGADVATRWLDEQIGNAVNGLVPVAVGQGQLAKAAQSYLREKQRLGFGDVIAKALKSIPKADAEKLRQTVLNVPELGPPLDDATTPKELKALVAAASELSSVKGSDWLDARKLPPLSAGKHSFSQEQVHALLIALQHSELGAPHSLVAQMREFADGASLAEFAWALFEEWLANGAPAKHKWAMRALGLLGNDDTALQLTPLVRAWPGESQHPRAVLGLECLRAIGSNVALMQLSGIAQKIKFKGLQRKAMDCVAEIAAEKGMSRDELEDRVVPDCGLDERGSRTFDYGDRQFFFALDADNKPVIRDDDGKIRKDLPQPAAKDDASRAKQALADWKLLKKQIREVVKIQNARLEQALITGRRWLVPDFEALLVRHPLMTNFVRRLLWAAHDAKGKRQRTFRVTEELDYGDAHDEPVTLDGCRDVGLIHPLHLSDEERSCWGELFADYEIVPPFPQLGRPIHRLSAAEKKDKSITKIEGLKIPALSLLGTLERAGWTRGMAQDNGVFMEHYKHFFAADLTVIVTYESGIGMGLYSEEEDQQIDGCFFVPGIYKPIGWPNHKCQVELGSVDPVVISEVLSDVSELEAKAI